MRTRIHSALPTMEQIPCPECRRPANRMPVLSYITRRDHFYLCEACKRVSSMPRDASGPPVICEAGARTAEQTRGA